MDPATLFTRLRPDGADGGPKAEGAVTYGNDRCAQTAALEIAQHRGPAIGALAIAVFDGDQCLRPVGPHADHHERAQAILLEPDAEVPAIDPHVHVVDIVQIPSPPRVVLRLPARRQPRD